MSVIVALMLVSTVWSGVPGEASVEIPDEPSGIEISVTIETPSDGGGTLPATGGDAMPMLIGGGIGVLLLAGGVLVRWVAPTRASIRPGIRNMPREQDGTAEIS